VIGLDAGVLVRLAELDMEAATRPDLYDMAEDRDLADTYRCAMPDTDDTTLALRLLHLSDAWEAQYRAQPDMDPFLFLAFTEMRAAVLELTSIVRGEFGS
jgi:hypothetical protein